MFVGPFSHSRDHPSLLLPISEVGHGSWDAEELLMLEGKAGVWGCSNEEKVSQTHPLTLMHTMLLLRSPGPHRHSWVCACTFHAVLCPWQRPDVPYLNFSW